MKIVDIKCREILDSRGFPTVETDVILDGGIIGRASIPSGASKGFNEALELRDNEKRFMGKGVKKAVSNVLDIIKPNIVNLNIKDQKELDDLLIKLDGTENKTNLGANAILSVSLAYLKACAKFYGKDGKKKNLNNESQVKEIVEIIDNKKYVVTIIFSCGFTYRITGE